MLTQIFTKLHPWSEAGGWGNHRNLVGTTQQRLTEHPWDVTGSSTGGTGCTHEPFQLEEVGSHWYVVSTSQVCNVDDPMHMPVPLLLKRWKHLEAGMDQSAEAFRALSERFKSHRRRWLEAERTAQLNRSKDCTSMDIYDTAITTCRCYQYSSYVFC